MDKPRNLTTDDYRDILDWIEQQRLPESTRKSARDLVLATARSSGIGELSKPEERFTTENRQRLVPVRKALDRKNVRLNDGREYEFRIPRPKGDKGSDVGGPKYIFELVEASASLPPLRRFWKPHFHAASSVFVFERLFFRTGNCYLRSLDVNRNEEGEVKRLREELGLSDKLQLRPSLHFINSGETAGAIVVQTAFLEEFGRRCKFRSGGNLDLLGNDIVFASPREIANILRKPGRFSPADFKDVELDSGRIIHVLVSREVQDGSTLTLICSNHGRASEGVCKKLCDNEWLLRNLGDLFSASDNLPEKFEVFLSVRLQYAEFGLFSFAREVVPAEDPIWTGPPDWNI
jgi:hypothetical protein